MASLQKITEEWTSECEFAITDIAAESNRTMKLHAKYLNHLARERLKLKQMDIERNTLQTNRREWYLGRLSQEEMKELGWQPMIGPKLLRSDADQRLEADQLIIDTNLKYALQKEKVTYLESVMDQIKQRSFLLRSALDWIRYTNGA